MKIKLQFELPLPEGFEPFLRVIAETHGYRGSESEISAEDFVCQKICVPQVDSLFRTLITNALAPYFGLAAQDKVDSVLAAYEQQRVVTAAMVTE